MFDERLKQLRLEKNITQAVLAQEIPIRQASISKYESGAMFPGYDVLIRLCQYFNVTADYLLGLSNVRQPYAQTFNSNLTEDEKVSLKYYRRLSSESQDIIKGKMVELYREENAKGKKQNRKQTG